MPRERQDEIKQGLTNQLHMENVDNSAVVNPVE